uniref:Ribosomal protein L32 n=1 Tax=Pediastrum duplex TaxID=3105 RepID=A0A5P8TYD3_PEDDU|nr:ribosomal protein L32 [Pediastrum duplex]
METKSYGKSKSSFILSKIYFRNRFFYSKYCCFSRAK